MRIMHEKPETAGAKMSVLCSFCVHHVAANGEAVNSNLSGKVYKCVDVRVRVRYNKKDL